jgi:hypothetical protein
MGSLRLACALLVALGACADEHDDNAQLVESASVPPQSFESNSLLEVLTLDSTSCDDEAEVRQPGFELYQDANSFRAAYLAARPGASQVPSVDFARYVVVGAFLGLEASCSVKIEVAGARYTEEHVDVDVKVTRPDACGAGDGLTYPFTFARLNRVDKPYVSVERSESVPCP